MTEIDTTEAARDYFNELHGTVTVGEHSFDAARVLEECDPIAFRQLELDLIDSNVKGGDWYEWADESIHDEPEEEEHSEPDSLICSDCAMWAVNRDDSGAELQWDGREAAAEFSVTGDTLDFSSAECDACGTSLAGVRWGAFKI